MTPKRAIMLVFPSCGLILLCSCGPACGAFSIYILMNVARYLNEVDLLRLLDLEIMTPLQLACILHVSCETCGFKWSIMLRDYNFKLFAYFRMELYIVICNQEMTFLCSFSLFVCVCLGEGETVHVFLWGYATVSCNIGIWGGSSPRWGFWIHPCIRCTVFCFLIICCYSTVAWALLRN